MDARQIQEFLEGYIVCALWSSTDNADPSGGEPLDKNYDEDDLTLDAARRMAIDCTLFCVANQADLTVASATRPWDHLGHDLWLTRNGHGTGFWDRSEIPEAVRERLSEAARKLNECHLYVEDGTLRIF